MAYLDTTPVLGLFCVLHDAFSAFDIAAFIGRREDYSRRDHDPGTWWSTENALTLN